MSSSGALAEACSGGFVWRDLPAAGAAASRPPHRTSLACNLSLLGPPFLKPVRRAGLGFSTQSGRNAAPVVQQVPEAMAAEGRASSGAPRSLGSQHPGIARALMLKGHGLLRYGHRNGAPLDGHCAGGRSVCTGEKPAHYRGPVVNRDRPRGKNIAVEDRGRIQGC